MARFGQSSSDSDQSVFESHGKNRVDAVALELLLEPLCFAARVSFNEE